MYLFLCVFFFVCYRFQSSLDETNRSLRGFLWVYPSSWLSVSIRVFFFLDAVFCGGFGNFGMRGVSFARGLANRGLGAESDGLSVLQDSEFCPGVGCCLNSYFLFLTLHFVLLEFFFWDDIIAFFAAGYGILFLGQLLFPSFGPCPFDWKWNCGSQGFPWCSGRFIVPCSCGNSTI